VFEISIGYLESESLLQASSEGPYEANTIILYKMCTCPSYLYLYHSGIFLKKDRLFIYLLLLLFSFLPLKKKILEIPTVDAGSVFLPNNLALLRHTTPPFLRTCSQ
jgi:hypothetical protein